MIEVLVERVLSRVIVNVINSASALNQFLWCNSYIKIDNKAIYLKFFSTKNINFMIHQFHSDGSVTH